MSSSTQKSRLLCRGIAFAFLLVTVLPEAMAETFIVVVNHAPPYRIVEPIGGRKKFSGFYVEIANEMARRANMDLQYVERPFKRALSSMKDGSADIMLGPNRTSKREQFMFYLEQALPREKKRFYLKPDAADILRYEDLKDQTVAVLRGAVYFERFDTDQTLIKEKVNDYESGLKMVARDRLNTVIIPELLGDYLIKNFGFNLKKASLSYEGRPSYIAISKQSFLARKKDYLNSILGEMKNDGTFQKLLGSKRE